MVVKALRTHILCSHFYSCRALYISLTVSRVVCRALQLYISRYASTALQLYSALHSTTSAPTLWKHLGDLKREEFHIESQTALGAALGRRRC
jgi:hypothetical protein